MNKDFVEHLKGRISIVDVVSARIRLRKIGNVWKALCPFHKEKTGSFHVDETKGLYHCFGCGAGGDSIKFVMDYEKVSFLEAVEIIANQYGIEIPRNEAARKTDPAARLFEIMDYSKNYFIRSLNSKSDSTARDYLSLRRINKEQIEKFQLGFAPANADLYNQLKKKGFSDEELVRTGVFIKFGYKNEFVNRYRGRLIFPIIDAREKCVGFGGRILEKSEKAKYINSPETEIYKKSQQLYGYNLARKGKSRQIIISEGYLDVISLHQAGFDGAVAPLGTAISESQINMCWRVCSNPVIALDGDSAGIKASYRWVDRILTHLEPGKSFKFAALPQGSDPDLLVYNNRISAITEAVNNAVPLSQWLWDGGFSLYPSETPEQKAELIEMLIQKAESIKNISIKNFYIQDIKNRQRSLYKRKKRVTKKENLQSASSAKEKIEKILVVTLLNHPYIIDRVMEDFVKLEFENTEVRGLKEKILRNYADFAEEIPQRFIESMVQLQDAVSEDFKDVAMHASFADKNVDDNCAFTGWSGLLKKYLSEPLLVRDLQKASSDFVFSEDSWQRLKALKNEVLNRRKR
ncbi:MAG: DNA primase [Alphaproteobacteria bacterium]|nr:DNA primase [Alphaproteobacteria bacterium]